MTYDMHMEFMGSLKSIKVRQSGCARDTFCRMSGTKLCEMTEHVMRQSDENAKISNCMASCDTNIKRNADGSIPPDDVKKTQTYTGEFSVP